MPDRLGRVERLEHLRQDSGGMPEPVSVTQRTTYSPGRAEFGGDIGVVELGVGGLDGQLAAVGHGVAGVDGKVEQAVFHLIGVGPGAPEAAGQDGFDLDRLPHRALKQFLHAAHQRVQVEAGGGQRLAPCEGEQALGQVAARSPAWREVDMAEQVRRSASLSFSMSRDCPGSPGAGC